MRPAFTPICRCLLGASPLKSPIFTGGATYSASILTPTDAQSLPTDSTEIMGQPPQVEFNADELSVEGLMERVKNIPWWGWLVGAGAVVGGAKVYNKMK